MAKTTRKAPGPHNSKYTIQKPKAKPGQGPRDLARKELGITTRFTESSAWEDPIQGHTGPHQEEQTPLDQVNSQIDQEAMLEQISDQVASEMDDYDLDDDDDLEGDLEEFGLDDDTTDEELDEDTTTEERYRIEEANEGHRFGNDTQQLFKPGTTWGVMK